MKLKLLIALTIILLGTGCSCSQSDEDKKQIRDLSAQVVAWKHAKFRNDSLLTVVRDSLKECQQGKDNPKGVK
jgi:hypothetical protein